MIARKSLHFFRKILWVRPASVPGMLLRRALETLRRPPVGIATTWIDGVRFDVDLRLHSIARKYYFRTHEMYLETVFHRYLKQGSIFIDIGANMGYWSAVALSRVGKSGEVHAFEPVPAFFASLRRLAASNPGYVLIANQIALGAEEGVLPMAVVSPTPENYNNFDTNIGTSSVLPGFLDHDARLTETIEVRVATLDDYIANNHIDLDRIGLIKIDVEGYESFCFDGMQRLLNKSGRKVPILCEVLTDTARHEKLDGSKVVRRMEAHGYRCLDATTLRPIKIDEMQFEENILCVGG
jgi:FkbM family methyltransferase